MDLYDDIDTKPRGKQMDGWSSGIKMLQTQIALKKASLVPKDIARKPLVPPTVKARKAQVETKPAFHVTKHKANEVFMQPAPTSVTKMIIKTKPLEPVVVDNKDGWECHDEYDPRWPNEYEKLNKERQSHKDKSRDNDKSRGAGRNEERERERNSNYSGTGHGERKRNRGGGGRNHAARNNSPPVKFSGFMQRPSEEDSYDTQLPGSGGGGAGGNTNKGVAIAPPASLQEISIVNEGGDSSSNVTIPYSASSVAAKIMAKYGFRDGQGLGKQEQGMSIALQVEKTSKRGGRIIHEKELFLPPPDAVSPPSTSMLPPAAMQHLTTMPPPAMPPPPAGPSNGEQAAAEPSITEIMKEPSKVVLLRNMVGPGDVDEDLEPEVKDECNTKYGEVMNVVIHEAFGTVPEDAVKIYVEFKRIESAIKAVVDLNGRFFGGRQVRAGFYNLDKFKRYQLH